MQQKNVKYIWLGASLAFSIFVNFFNTMPEVAYASFFTKTFAIIIGSLCGWCGAIAGDAIRRFTHPDAFFTTGGILSILGTKTFWLIGPQLIGLIIGTLIGAAIIY
ncbi:hypothetical protein [Chromohalobacter canadensis]|uniref:hypothetical protein n=1 Tax=Chromohalobacter canadensis TaxID=141389 RepID=UPI002410784A|nr:hypothetical protein [Chromohalobacter canadensis]